MDNFASSVTYDFNVGAFNTILEVSEIVLISFNSFFFFPLWFIYFYHSIFYIIYPIQIQTQNEESKENQ